MLPPRYRLHSRSEISAAIKHGRRARRGTVVVHVHVGDESTAPSRAAFAVSKSVGDSVTRHRVVRRLRGVMPPLLDRLPGGSDVVVRAMPEAAGATSEQLRGDVEAALERVVPMEVVPRGDVSGDADVDGAEADSTAVGTSDPERAPRGLLFWLGWPIRSLLLGLIWVYRHTISPMLPPTCRYHPSCSAYGFQALQVHGAAKGSVLTAWRVLRCNPFTDGGLDPVPPRGAWRPDIHPDGTPRVAGQPAA